MTAPKTHLSYAESTPRDRLAAAFDRLVGFALAWSLRIAPIGSHGFELASGVCSTNAASDLDVLVHAAHVPRRALLALASHIDALAIENAVRVDAELRYFAGGIALRASPAGCADLLAAAPLLRDLTT